jgi:serine/threonine protein kinase
VVRGVAREGTVLNGHYRLIRPIGAGGFGQVWKAHDLKVDRKVAVKVLTSDGDVDHDRQLAGFARGADGRRRSVPRSSIRTAWSSLRSSVALEGDRHRLAGVLVEVLGDVAILGHPEG